MNMASGSSGGGGGMLWLWPSKKTVLTAGKRIEKDLGELNMFPPADCNACPFDDNLYHWAATIKCPPGAPYQDDMFFLEIKFPCDYPFKPPKVILKNPIHHCNVDSSGNVNLNILKDGWSPDLTISKVLLAVRSIFLNPEPSYSKITKEEDEHLEAITNAVNHTTSDPIPLEIMSSSVKPTKTCEGHGPISFESLVKNKNKVKAKPSIAVLSPKDKKRKAIETMDLSNPKKTSTASIDKPKVVVPIQNVAASSSPPGDFDTLSTLLVKYLHASKVQMDEATERSSIAEKRASDLSIQLCNSKEKLSKALLEAKDRAIQLEHELSSVKVELSGVRGELVAAKGKLSKTKVELSNVRDMYDEVQKDYDVMYEKSAQMAMDLAMFFGQKARLELLEAHAKGKHTDWDFAAAQQAMDKEFLNGCPHADWLKKAGLVELEGNVESSSHTEDLGDAKGDGDAEK